MRNLDMKNKLTSEIATKNNNDALSKDLGLIINEMHSYICLSLVMI